MAFLKIKKRVTMVNLIQRVVKMIVLEYLMDMIAFKLKLMSLLNVVLLIKLIPL